MTLRGFSGPDALGGLDPGVDPFEIRSAARTQDALAVGGLNVTQQVGRQFSRFGAGDAAQIAITGADQQLRMRSTQARDLAYQPSLVLPLGDGLGADVRDIQGLRPARRDRRQTDRRPW